MCAYDQHSRISQTLNVNENFSNAYVQWRSLYRIRGCDFNIIELIYLHLYVCILICAYVIVPIFLRKYEFLPLLMISCYCAFGVCYSFVMLYVDLYHTYYQLRYT